MDNIALCREIRYDFRDPQLLRQALTHRSHSSPHNERLEFLGDSVLNCVIAQELFRRFPEAREGALSRLRANLVNQETLCAIANQLNLGECLRLGEGEAKSGGRDRPSILADALEAIFGAIFLDGGFLDAQRVIQALYAARLSDLSPKTPGKDPKTLLQEYLQGLHIALPEYNVVAVQGKAHQQRFRVECVVADLDIRCLGEGESRRKAEQEAAKAAYRLATGESL